MDKNTLKMYVDSELSTHQIADKLKIGQTTVRYWLSKFGLKTKNRINVPKICPKCKIKKDRSEFYNRRNKSGTSSYCKSCSCEQVVERQRRYKKLCVEYKGGKCELCTYSKYIGALEFHHKDASEKEFTIAYKRLKSIKANLSENVKKELDKCSLLCATCHREEHGRLSGLL